MIAIRAGPFGLAVLREKFRGSIEHVVQSSRVDRESKFDPGFYRKPGRSVRPPLAGCDIKNSSFLKAISDAIERLDHLELVVHDLEFLA
jgi:hypothetical protein